MNISLKKAFSIIAFTSVMLTLSIYIGFSMFHQYKYEQCVSLKASIDSSHPSRVEYWANVNALECLEVVN